MKKVKILLVAVMVLPLVFWSCQNKKDVMKIGFVFPLTGNSANHGNDFMQGAYMAYEDFKQTIDTTSIQIKFLVEDNFSTSKSSVSAFEKLIQIHKPWIVLGPVASSDMLAMVPIAEKNATILFSPAASSPHLSNAGKYIFRMALLAPDQTSVISKYAYNDLNVKEAAVLYTNDETGISYMNSFVDDYTALGGSIIYNESFEKENTDFMPQLLKLRASKSKVVYLSGSPKLLGIILKQAKEINLDVKFLGGYGAEGNDLIDIAQNAAEGFVYTSMPMDVGFIEKYKSVHQKNPNMGVAVGYDAISITLKLLLENSQDKEQFRNALSQLEYNGVTGWTKILPSGDASKELILKTIKNGKFELYHLGTNDND